MTCTLRTAVICSPAVGALPAPPTPHLHTTRLLTVNTCSSAWGIIFLTAGIHLALLSLIKQVKVLGRWTSRSSPQKLINSWWIYTPNVSPLIGITLRHALCLPVTGGLYRLYFPFPVWLPHSPTSVSWVHLPNKLFVRRSLSQDLPLREPKSKDRITSIFLASVSLKNSIPYHYMSHFRLWKPVCRVYRPQKISMKE